MRVLSLETADKAASVAVLEDQILLAHQQLPLAIRSAQSLASGIQSILSQVGWKPSDVELVAVAQGPGSFTGLRVGVVSAKVFAWSVNAEILGVSTLEAIAENVPPGIEKISAALDCQRGQVVYQNFARSSETGFFVPQSEEIVADTEDWLAQVPEDYLLSGPILGRTSVKELVCRPTVDSAFWTPTATGIGQLAVRQYLSGLRSDVWQLLPRYSRPAAAEEKLLAKREDCKPTT